METIVKSFWIKLAENAALAIIARAAMLASFFIGGAILTFETQQATALQIMEHRTSVLENAVCEIPYPQYMVSGDCHSKVNEIADKLLDVTNTLAQMQTRSDFAKQDREKMGEEIATILDKQSQTLASIAAFDAHLQDIDKRLDKGN